MRDILCLIPLGIAGLLSTGLAIGLIVAFKRWICRAIENYIDGRAWNVAVKICERKLERYSPEMVVPTTLGGTDRREIRHVVLLIMEALDLQYSRQILKKKD